VLNASWNIYNFRLPLLKHLSDAGHEIVAIAPEDEYTDRIPYEFHPIKIKSRSLNPFKHLFVLLGFLRIFKKAKPDIALLYTIYPNVYGNLAARMAGVRTISNIAGLGNLFIHKRLVSHVAKPLYKMALSHSDTVFFQNYSDMALFRELGLVSEQQSERIPGSGVDIERFSPLTPSEREIGKDERDSTFIFLLATRLLWEKGVREFVDAAMVVKEIHEKVRFVLVGPLGVDNPTALKETDIRLLTNGGLIEYAGVSDQMEQIIQDVDCVVLPSYREGLPKILLEAAAMAKPIITTRVPGCEDVVDHNVNGLLCEARDARDLAAQMVAMLEMNEENRQQMGARGREKIVNEYAQEIVLEHYENAVSSIQL